MTTDAWPESMVANQAAYPVDLEKLPRPRSAPFEEEHLIAAELESGARSARSGARPPRQGVDLVVRGTAED